MELFSALQSFVPDIHWQHLNCTDVFLRIQQQLSTPVPNRAEKKNKNTRSSDDIVAAASASTDVILCRAVQVDSTCDISLWFD